ncbi:MAG: hypothetical protein GXO87_09630 [Chlorobi bacterium]|nr:hypothetical protein [Chlorobiota bacterium]
MKTNYKTYRFIAALLLTAIVSHLTLFHFQMEEKVLCVHNDGFSHLENIDESHLSSKHFPASEIISGVNKIDCADYKLDKHLDENLVKIFNKISLRFKKSLFINFNQIKKAKIISFLNGKNIIPHNAGLESLATVSLLI